MSNAFPTTATNPHLSALEPALVSAARPVEVLVVAHNDSRMLKAIFRALSRESAAVLEMSQDRWDFGDDQQSEAIEWALRQGNLNQLLLVGSSQAGGTQPRATLVANSENGQAKRGFERLVENVERNHSRIRAAQDRFAEQVRQLSQLPLVREKRANGELKLFGLFYQAESGGFLAYDLESGNYRALVATR